MLTRDERKELEDWQLDEPGGNTPRPQGKMSSIALTCGNEIKKRTRHRTRRWKPKKKKWRRNGGAFSSQAGTRSKQTCIMPKRSNRNVSCHALPEYKWKRSPGLLCSSVFLAPKCPRAIRDFHKAQHDIKNREENVKENPILFSGLSHPSHWSIPHTFSGLSHIHSLAHTLLKNIRFGCRSKEIGSWKGREEERSDCGMGSFFLRILYLSCIHWSSIIMCGQPAVRTHSYATRATVAWELFHMPHYAFSVALFKCPAPIFPPSFLIIFARQQQCFIGSSWWSLSWKRE